MKYALSPHTRIPLRVFNVLPKHAHIKHHQADKCHQTSGHEQMCLYRQCRNLSACEHRQFSVARLLLLSDARVTSYPVPGLDQPMSVFTGLHPDEYVNTKQLVEAETPFEHPLTSPPSTRLITKNEHCKLSSGDQVSPLNVVVTFLCSMYTRKYPAPVVLHLI